MPAWTASVVPARRRMHRAACPASPEGRRRHHVETTLQLIDPPLTVLTHHTGHPVGQRREEFHFESRCPKRRDEVSDGERRISGV